ncbi:MAG: hypothetical protein A2086_00230 [Spirochaetes bacterium GWD1_27_9]|nr:MAG: hypothetical protein A2Z98_00345 [Spirochaetes bacterium GWB1_27_13]OHD27890.1 MAG: hypothetical protein A2Y34_14605 [Spirochaetes bacterium GWC1_27_15]OHD32659.1 MAG: hypothetical protein A2086_00230 [Spirochaetes bacterium GWD1_27_9]
MKFRGDIWFSGCYYFPVLDGIKTNYFNNINYSKLNYTNENDTNFTHHYKNDPGRMVGGWGGLEGKLYVDYSCIAPFFRGDNFLISDNKINFKFKFELSPVSLSAGLEFVLTPVAFFQFYAGVMLGSGWNIGFNGLGRNNTDGRIKDKPQKVLAENFYGVVIKNWFILRLQFDLAAVMPINYKRWTHIILLAISKFERLELTNVDSTQPYEWENDGGKRMNGWYLYSDFLVGYQIPVIEDRRKQDAENKTFLGYVRHNDFSIYMFMLLQIYGLHITHFSDSMIKDRGWGSDFVSLRFGPTIYLTLPNNFYAFIGFNFLNDITYTDDSIGNLSYMKRKYDNWYVYFGRILLTFGYSF